MKMMDNATSQQEPEVKRLRETKRILVNFKHNFSKHAYNKLMSLR